MDKCRGFKTRWDNIDGDQETQQTQDRSRYWFLLGWTDAERQTCSDCGGLILQRHSSAVETYCPLCEQKEALRKAKNDVDYYKKIAEGYKKIEIIG